MDDSLRPLCDTLTSQTFLQHVFFRVKTQVITSLEMY